MEKKIVLAKVLKQKHRDYPDMWERLLMYSYIYQGTSQPEILSSVCAS